jgi:site-specific recombinase XerD
MDGPLRYCMASAIDPTTMATRFVVVGSDEVLHLEASRWLDFLLASGRSPNTVREYGRRVGWFLSWCSGVVDWRSITLSHIVMWRRALASDDKRTSSSSVSICMVAMRSFYEWCDGHGLLMTDVVAKMTQVKYFAPGTRGGGERGARRRVLVDALQVGPVEAVPPRWIDDDGARDRLAELKLPSRDRFLIDLLSSTGIRVGEALSMFTADLHFGGGSRELGCGLVDPHFHVRVDNPVENAARAKGGPRTLFVHRDLVDSYVDYALERRRVLQQAGVDDRCPHVFVNLYSEDRWLGRAASYSTVKRLLDRCAKRIGYDITGPHMLRHTFATRLVRGLGCEPVALDVVQAVLGHAVLVSTQVYTHDTEAAMKTATLAMTARSATLGGTP